MATIVNRRRGTTAQHAAFTGAVGETTYNTDAKILVAHDGATVGGFPAAHLHVNNLFSIQQRITTTANAPQLILTTSAAQSTQAFQIFQPDGTTQLFGVNFEGTTEVYRQAADTTGAQLHHLKRGTTGSATAAVGSGDQLSQDNFKGWDGAAFVNGAQMRVATTETFTPIARGSQFEFYTVNTGATGLALSATLRATSVEVYSRLLLPNTTSATVGGIYFGGVLAVHNFGAQNFFAGVNAGNLTMAGTYNAFFGYNSGVSNALGQKNSFFGNGSGLYNSDGSNNSFFGNNSGYQNTVGVNNSFFGFEAGEQNVTGYYNSFFGAAAGRSNTSNFNSFFGADAGSANTTGDSNTFFGFGCGVANIDGVSNSFFGRSAGAANTSGASNVFFGRSAGQANLVGNFNTFFGSSAGVLSEGSNNLLFGHQAGDNITTGSNNLILGFNIDAPSATASGQLSIGNLIFGTSIDGTGTTISSGNIGIAVVVPTSGLHLGRSFAAPYRAISGTDTFAATDYTINVTSGTFTLNLPTAVGITGRIYVAKNSGVGSITLDPAGAELIDGSATATIVAGAALMVQSTGAGWIII